MSVLLSTYENSKLVSFSNPLSMIVFNFYFESISNGDKLEDNISVRAE
jgi:hypothetical protein